MRGRKTKINGNNGETGRKDAEEGEEKKRGKMLIKAKYFFFSSLYSEKTVHYSYIKMICMGNDVHRTKLGTHLYIHASSSSLIVFLSVIFSHQHIIPFPV